MSAIHDHNRQAWDARARQGERFARPAPDEQFKDPLKQLDPRGWLKGVKAFTEGHRQGRTQGDAWQQGGVLVVGKTGDVKWQHASDLPGDNASAQQILAAL